MSEFSTAELDSFYDIDFGAEVWSQNANPYTVLFNEKDRTLRVRSAEFGDNPLMFDTWIDDTGKTWYVSQFSNDNYDEYFMPIVDWAPVEAVIQQQTQTNTRGARSLDWSTVSTVMSFFEPQGTQEIEYQGKIQSVQTFKINILHDPSFEFIYGFRVLFDTAAYNIVQIKDPDNQKRRLELTCILASDVSLLGGFPYKFPITLP